MASCEQTKFYVERIGEIDHDVQADTSCASIGLETRDHAFAQTRQAVELAHAKSARESQELHALGNVVAPSAGRFRSAVADGHRGHGRHGQLTTPAARVCSCGAY